MIPDFSSMPLVGLVNRDVQEMISIGRVALEQFRHQQRVAEGLPSDRPEVELTIHDVDRFDDLSAVYGISPIAAVHVEGQPVSWSVCELILLATMHVVTHRFIPAVMDARAPVPKGPAA